MRKIPSPRRRSVCAALRRAPDTLGTGDEGGSNVEGTFCGARGTGARIALGLSACGGSDESANDLLALIEDKAAPTVSTLPAYPPQSELNEETGEYEGFDIHVATEIAERMGVDNAWEAPGWGKRSPQELERPLGHLGWLDDHHSSVPKCSIHPPDHYTPAAMAVYEENSSITEAADLDGKKVGVCGGCTYGLYPQNKLQIAQDVSGEPE